MIKLIKRKLEKNEVSKLFLEIKSDQNITGYSFSEWMSFDKMWIAEVDGKFAAVGNIRDYGGNWVELGLYYVLKKYRGMGIGTTLFNKTYDEVIQSNYNIYIVSRNPVMVRILKKKKFKITKNFFSLPTRVVWTSIIFALSLFRIKEYFRKIFTYPRTGKLIYGIIIKK